MHRQKGEKILMYDRENDNRNNEGRQVQQELEDQLRAFGDTMTDAFAHGFEGRGMDIGDRAWDVGKAAVHAANYGIGEAAKAFRQGRRGYPYGDAKQPSDEGAADPTGMPGWFRQIFAKPEPTPVESIRISAKKRYSAGCTLLAVGITFAVIFGLGGIGCIAASDALLPGLITETMIGDTVATAAEGMTYTFTTGASMATTVLEITGNVLTLVACGFGAMIAAGASRLSASKKLRLLADAAEGEDYKNGLPVEMLADLTHQKKAKALKKLRRYINKGWLAAWLDEKTEKLYLTVEDYRAAQETAAALQAQPQPEPAPEQREETPLNLETARRFVQVLEKEQQLMQDPQAREELEQMQKTAAAICDWLEAHPESLPKARRFAEYYIPTTLKLLHTYNDVQGQQGENAETIRRDIAGILHTLNQAYDTLYDTLLSDVAMDVSSEIAALQGMLANDGLTGGDFQ